MTSPDPSAELKLRILAAVQAEPAPTRHAAHRRAWLALGISAATAVAIFAHFGGIRATGRPGLLILLTCLGWSVVGSVAAALAVFALIYTVAARFILREEYGYVLRAFTRRRAAT
jgi:hypothetical protein